MQSVTVIAELRGMTKIAADFLISSFKADTLTYAEDVTVRSKGCVSAMYR